MIYRRICNNSNATNASTEELSVYPSRAHEFMSLFVEVRVARSWVLYVAFCRSYFVGLFSLFLLAIVFPVIVRIT